MGALSAEKLRAARVAAAEVFIAGGLESTDWDADKLRAWAAVSDFWVKYSAFDGEPRDGISPAIELRVDQRQRGEFVVTVEPRNLGRLSVEEAFRVATRIASVSKLARKAQAAIAETLR